MESTSAPFHVQKNRSKITQTLLRWFPMPEILFPHAAGIDISDSSIKWVTLEGRGTQKRVHSFGEKLLTPGVVVNGTVKDFEKLVAALREMKKDLKGVDCAHVALPEENAYVFNMIVPEGSSRAQILSMIEFELDARVPIELPAAVYDFNVIEKHGGGGQEIGVVVFPRELAQSYAAAFDAAGILLLSLEVEARSTARAISTGTENEPITLLVDFGRARTGLAVLKHGVPIFTSTVAVGGETMTKAVMDKLTLSAEDAEKFKDEEGLLGQENGAKSSGSEALSHAASALADEVVRHYRYWDTRRDEHGDRVTPIEKVVLVGGTANLRGLADYIAARTQAPTERPNIWQHVCSFDEYIPPLDWRASLQYSTAVGLALRGA